MASLIPDRIQHFVCHCTKTFFIMTLRLM